MTTVRPTDRQWIRVTTIDNIPEREGRMVHLGGLEIAIFNLGDRFLATDNRCPHEGGPLCDGIVTGDSVVCPLHAWKINLKDGNVERPTHGKDHCVSTYPTRVDDGIVSVEIPGSCEGTRLRQGSGGQATTRGAELSAERTTEGHAA